MNISKEILKNNNWELRYEKILNEDYFGIHIVNDSGEFDLTIHELSNMIGRDWCVHVDNNVFCTIGSCDIQTVEHFNDFMKVLEIDYKLEV